VQARSTTFAGDLVAVDYRRAPVSKLPMTYSFLLHYLRTGSTCHIYSEVSRSPAL
jgi:hypothetical protein